MPFPINGSLNVAGSVASYKAIKNIAANTVLGTDDLGKTVVANASNSITVTLPSGAPVGFQFELINVGTGTLRVEPSAGDLVFEENGFLGVKLKGKVSVLKINANTWFLEGQTNFVSSDIYFNNVSLLLNGQGANNSTIFTDESPNPKTSIATNGSIISTTQFKYGSSSMYFNGANYLEYAAHDDLGVGTGDFTAECFYFPVEKINTYPAILLLGNNWAGSDDFYLSDRNNTYPTKFSLVSQIAGIFLQSTTTVTNGQWYHIAVVRTGTTIRLFINGILEATATNQTYSINSNKKITIGGSSQGYHNIKGYLHLRLTKGIARYTANFTPPANFSVN